MDILNIKGISKSYGDHLALKDIHLDIPKNSIFGLLGPNGAGKTTLIRIITNIIMPDAGSISFKGSPLEPGHIRAMGYLPEERGLYKKMKVSEQLVYLARLKGMSKSEAVKKIKEWFEKLDITSWYSKNVEDLSKGMQQKVQFIATVMHQPELIILDEPFSGFDPINANLIKDEILKMKENGASIIFSTHRMESVEELCDDICLINDSSIVLNGGKKEIRNQYRSNTFIIEHKGHLNFSLNGYNCLSSDNLEDDIVRSEIQIPEDQNLNDLLISLTNKVQIVSATEKIPSINDIFISEVTKSDNG
ncbi:MAG: ABC-2 type transport system ATP-binding protein [Cyclobacteriaceae bacterium]